MIPSCWLCVYPSIWPRSQEVAGKPSSWLRNFRLRRQQRFLVPFWIGFLQTPVSVQEGTLHCVIQSCLYLLFSDVPLILLSYNLKNGLDGQASVVLEALKVLRPHYSFYLL